MKNLSDHDYPKKGEQWDSLDGTRTCRVMSDPIEGYVMARWKGAMPWLLHVNDWTKRFKRGAKTKKQSSNLLIKETP